MEINTDYNFEEFILLIGHDTIRYDRSFALKTNRQAASSIKPLKGTKNISNENETTESQIK